MKKLLCLLALLCVCVLMTGLIASDAHAAGVVAKYKTDYAVAPGGTVLKGNNLPAVETWTFYSDNTVSYVLNLSSGKTYNGSTSYASSTNGSNLYRISPSADFSGYNCFYKDGTSVYREKDGYKYLYDTRSNSDGDP